jgi:VanZ family protein
MSQIIQRKRNLRLLCLLWGILLVALAIQPDKVVEIFLPLSIMRDAAHGLTYGVLTFFICLYLCFRRHVQGIPMTFKNAALLAFILTAVWGGFTEWIQHFIPDRYVSMKDWVCDMIGALFGIICFRLREMGYAKERLPKIRR